jgi:hypothetical protein
MSFALPRRRDGEGEDAEDGHRHAHPYEEGPELAPARLGAVRQHAHDGVEEGVRARLMPIMVPAASALMPKTSV